MAVRDRAGDETLDEGDGQIAEGRHGLGTVAGARATAVLVVAPVTDVVEGLDAPVAAHQAEDVAFVDAVRGQAGHAEDHLVTRFAVAQHGGALDAKTLGSIWEAQPGDVRRELERAGLDAAVALLTLGVEGEKAPSAGRRAAAAWSSGCP